VKGGLDILHEQVFNVALLEAVGAVEKQRPIPEIHRLQFVEPGFNGGFRQVLAQLLEHAVPNVGYGIQAENTSLPGVCGCGTKKKELLRAAHKSTKELYQKEEGNTTPILINKHGFSAALGRRAGQDVEAERPAVHKILFFCTAEGAKNARERRGSGFFQVFIDTF
jgi:hypothetical protein